MARQQGSGGKVSKGGGSRDTLIDVRFKIEGLDRTSAEFKAVRREINGRMRDTMVRVGERDLLPTIRQRVAFPWMAAALKIQRERSGVFVGTTLPGVGRKTDKGRKTDRALGYLDFGGRWHSSGIKYDGKRAILGTVDERRDLIDKRVLEAVMDEFTDHGFDASKGAV